MIKRLLSSPATISALAWLVAGYIRLVSKSTRVIREPADTDDALFDLHPLICTTWHGQFLMTPLIKPPGMEVSIMIARHGDAEIVARVMERFGMHPVRGAGAGDRGGDRGGATALRHLLRALKSDHSVMMTAEVPPGPAREASPGLIMAARMSGRPIVPCATVTGRFLTVDTWSRFTIGLPFSKLAILVGEPVWVARDADGAELELKRREVTAALNEVTDRAYRLAGGDPERTRPLALAAPLEPGVGLKLYRGLSGACEHIAPQLLRWRQGQGKEEAAHLPERLGEASRRRPSRPLVWFHAASVGETNAALPLLDALEAERPDLDFLLTTGTVTSAQLARARIPERVIHQYVPIDGPRFMARFLDHWAPVLGILIESEIWPNLVLEAEARDIPLFLVNARLSRRSYRRWRRMKSIARPLFGRLAHVLTQNSTLTRQFGRLGARKVTTTGNLKFDAPPLPADATALSALRAAIGTRPLLLAASTHPGEDEIVAETHVDVSRRLPGVLTIIVPRHPDRAADITAMLSARGIATSRRSEGRLPGPDTGIYVADTIGELGLFYALQPVAFVGGSLVPHGGQNPIEAIKHGAVVLTGPRHGNFDDAYKELIKRRGCVVAEDGTALSRDVSRLLSDETAREEITGRARQVIEDLGGAVPRTLDILRQALPASEGIKRAS